MKAKLDNANMKPAGFRITRILTDVYVQKLLGHCFTPLDWLLTYMCILVRRLTWNWSDSVEECPCTCTSKLQLSLHCTTTWLKGNTKHSDTTLHLIFSETYNLELRNARIVYCASIFFPQLVWLNWLFGHINIVTWFKNILIANVYRNMYLRAIVTLIIIFIVLVGKVGLHTMPI